MNISTLTRLRILAASPFTEHHDLILKHGLKHESMYWIEMSLLDIVG
jgi:hypothetical protein